MKKNNNKKQKDYKQQILTFIQKLIKDYPNEEISTHLSIICDISLSDKTLSESLNQYLKNLEVDSTIPHSNDIEDLLKDGMRIGDDDYFNDEEDDY